MQLVLLRVWGWGVLLCSGGYAVARVVGSCGVAPKERYQMLQVCSLRRDIVRLPLHAGHVISLQDKEMMHLAALPGWRCFLWSTNSHQIQSTNQPWPHPVKKIHTLAAACAAAQGNAARISFRVLRPCSPMASTR